MAIASAVTAISSTFTISAIFPAGQGNVTITNPGRAFRILAVLGTGTAASVITVKKNLVEFLATDNVFISVATQNATQCDILCVATGGGQVLTNAVA